MEKQLSNHFLKNNIIKNMEPLIHMHAVIALPSGF